MAAIRSKNTKPELALRKALREVGATGYRLHRKDVPGRPDLAFIRWKVAVFVDGVFFWHGHPRPLESRDCLVGLLADQDRSQHRTRPRR